MTTVLSQDIPAGTVRFHCPVCGGRNVEGQVIEHRETVNEMMVVSLGGRSTWWVVCSNCKARLLSKLDAQGLTGKPADALVGSINPYVSLVKQFLAVIAVLFSFLPWVGMVTAIIAFLVNRKTIGWTKTLTKVGVWLTVVFQLLFLFVLIFAGGKR